MKTYKNKSAFTLIELLVVITIIGILAGIALPVYSSIQVRGEQTKALSNAKQIGLGLKLWAGDNSGNFPRTVDTNGRPTFTGPAPANSNVVYRQLIPNYIPQEGIFFVAGSRFTPAQPDENVTGDAKLAVGENHYAYVPGLRETSNQRFPLVAGGFATAATGTYSTNPEVVGGVWGGSRAVVIRVDQSGALETTTIAGTGATATATVEANTGGAAPANIFVPASWTPNPMPEIAVNPQT